MVEQSVARKAEKLSAVKGMNDILPPESLRWESLEATVRELMARYAYRNIRTPILEHTALFVRGIGEDVFFRRPFRQARTSRALDDAARVHRERGACRDRKQPPV